MTTPIILTYANPATRPHAEFSPSALKNFESCPSYRGRSGTNPIAEAGTRIHEAIEKNDPGMLSDEVELSLAEWCISFLSSVREKKLETTTQVGSYQELMVSVKAGPNGTYGTSDLLEIYADGSATLMDWKTGYGAVEDAETNIQMQSYAYGAFEKFPDICEMDVYIVLPRRQEITHAVYTRADMGRIKLRVSTIIVRARELVGVEFNPTEGICDYCSKQGSCKALADKALTVGKKAGFEVPNSIEFDGTASDRGKILKLANLLSDWCEAAKREVLRQVVEDGAEVTGYRLENRKSPRTIDNPLLGFDSVKEVITIEEYLMSCTRVSVSSLEKIISDKTPKGRKAEAKQNLEDLLRMNGALRNEGTIKLLKAIKS